jgi:hypothetical protein
MVFKTIEEYEAYVGDPLYETDADSGICMAVRIEENISDPKVKPEDKKINIEIHAESQRGKTPASVGTQESTSQQNIPNTGNPSFDRYSKNPNARAAEMYVRQGYSFL